VRVFCFGIGHDVNTHLLDKITEETRAFSQYVLSEEDIEVKVSNFFAKIKDPVLTNPALTFTGDIRTTKLYPTPLPDLFRGEQLVLVGRYSGKGASRGSGRWSMVRRRSSLMTLAFLMKQPNTIHSTTLGDATRWLSAGGNPVARRARGDQGGVTELARKYSIVTPYTAYLIVEDEARRGVPILSQTLRNCKRTQSRAIRWRVLQGLHAATVWPRAGHPIAE